LKQSARTAIMIYVYIHLDVTIGIMIAHVVVIGLNITELLYLTPIWDGQNFIAIGVEILLAFSIL
jgi:hypothetical protein